MRVVRRIGGAIVTRHADAIARAYERLARARKVAAILRIVPAEALTPSGALITVELMEQATPEAWAAFAKLAGVNPPSAEIVREVIDTVRARMLPVNDNRSKGGQ